MSLLDYIKGFRKGKDARRLEIEAMSDPFLAEALEGYDSVKGDHASRIETMQKQVSKRTKPKKVALWVSTACSVAAVALFVLYFNHTHISADYSDDNNLYVYLPDDYFLKKKDLSSGSAPTVEIKNMDAVAIDEFDIYIPAEYVEKKKREIREYEQQDMVKPESSSVIISNIDEIFAPEEPIDVYLPDTYISKEKQKASPKVQIDNILN